MKPRDHVLEVWGEFACFTRPELKVERFSYPVITPSAARGIFDAIYCKPTEFRWQVTCVEILPPRRPGALPGINYVALRRNEVKEKVSAKKLQDWAAGKGEPEPIFADAAEEDTGGGVRGRTQRQTMALKDVHYRLHAHIHPWPGFEERLTAFEEQFRRRAAHGKCVYQPCFGCREFPAYFELVEQEPPEPPPLADLNLDVGLMLYDVFDLSRPGTCEDDPSVSLFHAKVQNGVMTIPPYEDPAVLKAVRSAS